MNLKKFFFTTIIAGTGTISSFAQLYNLPIQNDRWAIQPDRSIEWTIDSRLPHGDHIENGW